MNSPTQKLAERFDSFAKTFDRQKVQRQEQIQKQLLELTDRLVDNTNSNEQAYLQMKDRVTALREQVQRIDQTKKEMDKGLNKQMIKAQENFRIEIEAEKFKCKQEIQEWTKNADEKLLSICHSMEDATNEKGENVEALTERMTKKIQDLQGNLEQQKKKREDCISQLTQAIEKQLNRLYGQLDSNKKIRESTNKKINKMVTDIQVKLLDQLQQQRKARKQTNKALLGLLQETCVKIQKAFFQFYNFYQKHLSNNIFIFLLKKITNKLTLKFSHKKPLIKFHPEKLDKGDLIQMEVKQFDKIESFFHLNFLIN